MEGNIVSDPIDELEAGTEARIEAWRGYARAEGSPEDVDAGEARLRKAFADAARTGLDEDEAFLVALKRVGKTDEATRGFVREYCERLWDEPGPPGMAGTAPVPGQLERTGRRARTELWVMLGLAVAAALAVKLPALFGIDLDGGESFYMRNLPFFVLPFLVAYLAWKRRLEPRYVAVLGALFAGGAAIANAYPFESGGSTGMLTVLHLPIVLWLGLGVAHASGAWRSDAGRMEYVRFTGEWFVHYALIALGGGVLSALTMAVFGAIGLDAEPVVSTWVLPCGAAGAVLVSAWLVESKQRFGEAVAMLVALLVAVVWTVGGVGVERDVLILFDLLLVVVLALLLYAISARDPHAPPGLFDRIQSVLILSALAVDLFALLSILARLDEYGFSPNRTAALGLNLILLANLTWSARLHVRFLRRGSGFADLERWQMRFLPVYAGWGAVVVVVFPLVFGFA
jgi:hypothetical protein